MLTEPTSESTYALIDCCVANDVALSLAKLSSSSIVVTVAPLVPTFKFSSTIVPVPLAFMNKSSLDLFVAILLSAMVRSFKIIDPVPDVLRLRSALLGATKFCIDKSPSPANTRASPA